MLELLISTRYTVHIRPTYPEMTVSDAVVAEADITVEAATKETPVALDSVISEHHQPKHRHQTTT
jgi:hypothetical protein